MEPAALSLRHKLWVCPGFTKAINGVCLLYNGSPRADGYIKISYRHPETGISTTSTVHRMSSMLSRGTFQLASNLDASHLCHNRTCILLDHISLEPRAVNCQRRLCVKEGRCLRHRREEGSFYPECLLQLRLCWYSVSCYCPCYVQVMQ